MWEIFARDPTRLRKVASAIRATVEGGEVPPAPPERDEEDDGAEDGRILSRVRRRRERNRKLVVRKKDQVLRWGGRLQCEACESVYAETYRKRGRRFIEAHHARPVETLVPGSRTILEDLPLLCANCHRLIHVAKPWLTVEELGRLLGGSLDNSLPRCCSPEPIARCPSETANVMTVVRLPCRKNESAVEFMASVVS